MKEIVLSKGMTAIVDEDDFERLNQFKWYANYINRYLYARRNIRINGKWASCISMHREIMNPPAGMVVDHINHNTLDNRKENLRICTIKQNCQNRRSRTKTKTNFKGVTFSDEKGKFRSRINYNGKRVHLGYFDCKVEAARTYNQAATKFYGEYAKLNAI